jgi:glycosyltransferase involved in cell wall biosynthesis
MTRRVLIYRSRLLPASETFIQAQTSALSRYEPYFLGRKRVPGLALPAECTIVINETWLLGRLYDRLFTEKGDVPPHVRRHLQRIRPDLIHAHFAVDACLALPVARMLDVPLVVTMHGYDVTTSDNAFQRRSDRALRLFPTRRATLFREADRFIAISNFIRTCAERLGCPPERTRVLYIGIDEQRFTPAPSDPVRPLVLFVGRLVSKKGAEHLLRAIALVQAHVPDVETVFIGDGPLRESLERQSRSLRKVSFLGCQPASVVSEFLQQASVLCVPSIAAPNGDTEGLGMVFLEAQGSAVPVVSFNSGGISEAVEHGVTGLLAPPGDDEALAAHITRLLQNPELRRQMGAAGRARVEQRFSLGRQTALLEDLYDEVIAERRRGRSSPR